MQHFRTIAIAAALSCSAAAAGAQTATRVRGTIASIDSATVHVAPNEGGDDAIALPAGARVTMVMPTTLSAIKPGSFIGTAARTLDDGTMVAVEVHIFPESMRGAGEGHRPFDLGPKSTMTNGTVGQQVIGTSGETLTVAYKGGEKQIVVPPDAPVVAFEPGDRAMLVAGAHVVVLAQKGADGLLKASTLLVGKDGFVPPL